MKIAEICFSDGFGGLEMYMPRVGNVLKKKGHEVLAICKKGSRLEGLVSHYGLDCKAIPQNGYLDFSSYYKTYKVIKKFNPDVIHMHLAKDLWNIGFVSTFLSKKTKIFFTEQMGNKYDKKDFLHRFIHRNINTVIAISDEVRRRNLKYLPINENRSVRLHYGIEMDKFRPELFTDFSDFNNIYNVKDEIKIGLIGRLSPGKGHETFIKSAVNVLKENKNLKFFIVGDGDKEFTEKLKNIVKENSAESNIIFTGFCNEIPKMMAYMDLTVMGSDNEAFGMVVIESMAMKTPVIGTRAGGVPELIIEGKDGYLFEPNNVEELTEKLNICIKNKNSLSKMGEDARDKIEKEFTIDLHTEKILKIFRGEKL